MIEDIIKPEFVWWKDLTEDEKKVIQDSKEHPIFSIIYGMPDKDRREVYNSLRVRDSFFGIYKHTEKGWISFFEMCYCKDHHITKQDLKKECPESNKLRIEEMKEFLCSALPEKFRLYFAAKFRNEVEIIHFNDKTDAFFFQVDYHLRRLSN